jgi:hypothetical protein
MDHLLSVERADDLVGLLVAIASAGRLAHAYRDQAGYWASQVDSTLAADDAKTVARLLDEAADSLWLPSRLEQRTRVWASNLHQQTSALART